jgi:hypothetical protein
MRRLRLHGAHDIFDAGSKTVRQQTRDLDSAACGLVKANMTLVPVQPSELAVTFARKSVAAGAISAAPHAQRGQIIKLRRDKVLVA